MPRLWRNLRWERLSARMEKSRKPLERYTIKGVYLSSSGKEIVASMIL